jgi:hypothetical protein
MAHDRAVLGFQQTPGPGTEPSTVRVPTPTIAGPKDVLDQEHIVVRAEDDTDEEYAARSQFFAAALTFARKN